MQKNRIKHLGFIVAMGFTLSACGGGGGGGSSSNNNTVDTKPDTPTSPPKTPNLLTFPASEFGINLDVEQGVAHYSFLESYKNLINNLVSEETKILFQQSYFNTSDTMGWGIKYILTKDKLYFDENARHPQYLVSNTDSTFKLAYDPDAKGLTQTITFKNINLANEPVNSPKTMTHLLENLDISEQNEPNYIALKSSLNATTDRFGNDAICHQYLTRQFNQPNIMFEHLSLSGIAASTLEQWISAQKELGNTVVQEVWAQHKVAYVTKSVTDHFYTNLGYRNAAAVELDGRVINASYDPARVFDYKENYDSTSQFNAGICNLYNKSAARSLNTLFKSITSY